jgi:hypothetical protein
MLLLVAAIGCGSSGKKPASPNDPDEVELAPAPGWPAGVEVRSLPPTFRTSVTSLEIDPAGKVWLLRDTWSDPSQVRGVPILERYGPRGHLEKRITFAAHAAVSSFVIHPSGELSVFVMRDDDGDLNGYALQILRLSADGETIADVRFEETPGPRENLFYDQTGAHEVPVNGPFTLAFNSHVVGLPDGEGLYVLAEWTLSVKLYRLNADYSRAWGVQVFPANIGMVFNFSPSLLARDESGRLHVGYQLFEEDAPIYGEHFHRAPLVPMGSYDVLVQRFSPDGIFSGARLLGGVGVDHASAMTVRGGSVLVVGAARITKHDLPNRTMEWDLVAMRGSLDDTLAEEYRTFDLARDDFGSDMAQAADGTIYIGGRTDYVQVDTNSEVENGKGLLLSLSADLSIQESLLLPGPRDVQVRALRRLPDGRVVFAGMRDGPLTHTDAAMTNNDGVWGVADLGH